MQYNLFSWDYKPCMLFTFAWCLIRLMVPLIMLFLTTTTTTTKVLIIVMLHWSYRGTLHIILKRTMVDSNQKSLYDNWNRWAFVCRRKDNSDEAALICAGRLFHAHAAATGKQCYFSYDFLVIVIVIHFLSF